MTNSRSKSPPALFGVPAFICAVAEFILTAIIPHTAAWVVRISGVLVLAFAIPLMITPFKWLKTRGMVPFARPYYATTSVVDTGPYRVVRHPQYLGYCFLLAGFALITGGGVIWFPAVGGILGFYFQAVAEERHCLAVMGDDYRDYLSRVPRFNILAGIWRLFTHRRHAAR